MRSGPLRHRVSVQRQEPTRDEFGEIVANEWVEIGKRWAEVKPISGREALVSNQDLNEVTTRIRMRFFPIRGSDRIVFKERIYNIQFINNIDEQDYQLEILCQEGVAQNG